MTNSTLNNDSTNTGTDKGSLRREAPQKHDEKNELWNVVDENDNVIEGRLSLSGAESVLARCLNEDIDAYLVECNGPEHKSDFSDTHKEQPYIDAESSEDSEVAHVFMLYVPPALRRHGLGANVFNDWLSGLPKTVKRVRLKAVTLGGSDGLAFWKRLGFTEAFSGDLHQEIENTLVLGVNGYSNPVIEHIEPDGNEYRHWIEGKEDIRYFKNNPQVKGC